MSLMSQKCSKNMIKMAKCFRCKTVLEKENVLDYPYYCPECDENMYNFEAN